MTFKSIMANNIVSDLNSLYDAFRASMKGSAWKEEPQIFERDFLSELVRLQEELDSKTYRTSPTSEFILHERGKIRCIHGGRMRDRVVRHSYCDNVLTPALQKYLIFNNCASQKGRGIAKSRELFERDLHNFYLEYGDNEGYIGFIDLSKFYDNIRHDKVLEMLSPILGGDTWLLEEILRSFRVDVSYMSDEEYAACMEEKFDSVAYYLNIPPESRTGEKYMEKSADIGDQASQNIGVFFPTPLDNRAKIVRGVKRYGRYMDDIYIIGRTREEVSETIAAIREEAKELGVFINDKKTRIVKLSSRFKYLQIRYTLTASGRVMRRINPKSVTRERRRLKAYKRLLDRGEMPYDRIEQSYKSWMGTFAPLMSKLQISHMKALYQELFERSPRWKNTR